MLKGASTRQLIAHAVAQGFRVKRTKSGWVVYAKDGVRTVGMHDSKPSDIRAYKKRICDLRRIGVDIP